MARIRTVKPELPHDRKLASVSRDARYTFLLLITQADDDGLVLAEPRQLPGLLYPFDSDVDAAVLSRWLIDLESIGVVRFRATRDGAHVIEIVNWSKHQRIVNRGKPGLAHKLTEPQAGQSDSWLSLGSSETLARPSRGSRGAEGERDQGKGRGKGTPLARRDSRETLARPSRGSPGADAPARGDSWVARIHAVYLEHKGFIAYGRIGKALGPVIKLHGEDLVAAAAEQQLKCSKLDNRLRFATPEKLAEEITDWIAATKPISLYTENGEANPEALTLIGMRPPA